MYSINEPDKIGVNGVQMNLRALPDKSEIIKKNMGLFKKKAGGTLFGNLLRVASNKASGGIFGRGGNMIPVGGQSNQQTVLNTASGVGAAVEAYKSGVKQSTPVEEAIDKGAIMQWLKNNWVIIAAGFAGIFVFNKLFGK